VRRVAVGVLADLTADLTAGPATGSATDTITSLVAGADGARARRRLPAVRRRSARTPSFVLEGLPMTVAVLRRELASDGLREHRPRLPWFSLRPRADDVPDRVLIVAGPVDEALHQAWARRVLTGSHRSWRGFLGTWSGRDALPPSAALERALGHWQARVGPERIHVVVTGRDDPAGLAERVSAVLGHRPDAAHLSKREVTPDPVLLDLLRRVNEVLPFQVPEGSRTRARDTLASLMLQEQHGPRSIGVPRGRRAWARRRGVRLVEAVMASGVAVHGDLDTLPALTPSGRGLRAVDTVAAAVRMIHRIEQTGGPRASSAGEGTGR
jgi:hypothetical protein